LAHEMETILALVRVKSLLVSKEMTGVLLKGTDEIQAILRRVREGEPEVSDLDGFHILVEQTKDLANGGELPSEQLWTGFLKSLASLSSNIPAEFKAETDRLREYARKLAPIPIESEPKQADSSPPTEYEGSIQVTVIRALLRLAELQGLDPQTTLQLSSLLNELLDIAPSEQAKEALIKVLDSYEPYVQSIGFDHLLSDMIGQALEEYEQAAVDAIPLGKSSSTPPKHGESTKTIGKSSPPSSSAKVESGKSMRVSEEHIDTFLSHIGELFIVGELLSYLERKLLLEHVSNEVLREYREIIESFSTLSHNLQHSVMSVRKVPVKTLTQKVPRLVRDIASARNKTIAVETTGTEIEIDKSLVELLDAPLTHMVRNAADHGIETSEERTAAGKPEQGTVTVSVTEDEKYIWLKVSDDGKGLNYDAIQKKAESLGLIQVGKKLSEQDLVNFLFAAGVSTAEKVTDVSGRGVGMDVVKRAIEEAGGTIRVESSAGKGSSFSIQIPKAVTTQILESLIFEIGEQCFVIPLDRVNEAFACKESEFFRATGKDRYIFRHETMLPVVPAKEFLNVSPSKNSSHASTQHMLSVQANRRTMGIWVDGIVGVQQVVVKGVRNLGGDTKIYSGGALMGDGRIALILDVDTLCLGYDEEGLAAKAKVEREAEIETHSTSSKKGTAQELLLARVGEDRVAVPLRLVNRLEKFSLSEIETASGEPVVQYRDDILPLYDFQGILDQENAFKRESLHTIVFDSGSSQAGIVVDEIFDIAQEEVVLEQLDSNSAIHGTAIVREKITTILDLEALVAKKRALGATP
ncbi:MAG: chemotaxis protein CheW, partial [Bdellovibrionales bacterium]|nr:chemotaxis protein CheW [Bdellovibrionales bacterium]